jgi:hypothetical protein
VKQHQEMEESGDQEMQGKLHSVAQPSALEFLIS